MDEPWSWEPQMDDDRRRRLMASGAIALLVLSAVCVGVAPFFMPDSYSLIEHAISASGGQGVEHAWITRTGFLCLGFAVLILATRQVGRWGLVGRLVFRTYGVAMLATAAFAHKPWLEVPYVEFEDLLHSITASAVGAGFIVGVLIVTFGRGRGRTALRVFDWAAIVLASAIPMVMFNMTGVQGLVQRIMFVIGYLWFGTEAVLALRETSSSEIVDVREEREQPVGVS